MIGVLPLRGQDAHGSGEWQASRGTRRHNGIDLCCYPGTVITSPVSGIVTKIGLPYTGAEYRYVQVTSGGLDHRFFYIEPKVNVGDPVLKDVTQLGTSQDLTTRYAGITGHVHYEIKRGAEYIQPLI